LEQAVIEKHLTVSDHDRFLDSAVKFRERWNFPNVIGCIDGKHIRTKCPTKAGPLFYNYKQFFSIVLQGVADSESIFIFIDIAAYGKQSDGGIFSASTLYHLLEDFESTSTVLAVHISPPLSHCLCSESHYLSIKLYRIYVCYTNITLYIAFGIIRGFT
jgi:hypothetical protein